jgi:hypothetical protein
VWPAGSHKYPAALRLVRMTPRKSLTVGTAQAISHSVDEKSTFHLLTRSLRVSGIKTCYGLISSVMRMVLFSPGHACSLYQSDFERLQYL